MFSFSLMTAVTQLATSGAANTTLTMTHVHSRHLHLIIILTQCLELNQRGIMANSKTKSLSGNVMSRRHEHGSHRLINNDIIRLMTFTSYHNMAKTLRNLFLI